MGGKEHKGSNATNRECLNLRVILADSRSVGLFIYDESGNKLHIRKGRRNASLIIIPYGFIQALILRYAG